jgi:hypothetical protein
LTTLSPTGLGRSDWFLVVRRALLRGVLLANQFQLFRCQAVALIRGARPSIMRMSPVAVFRWHIFPIAETRGT